MRDVAVIGVGMNRWGELWEKSHRDIWTEAALEAVNDMIGISHLDTELVSSSESDEASYVELYEFVRVAAMLVYEERARRGEAVIS